MGGGIHGSSEGILEQNVKRDTASSAVPLDMSLRDGVLPSKQFPIKRRDSFDKIYPLNRGLLRPFGARNDISKRTSPRAKSFLIVGLKSWRRR